MERNIRKYNDIIFNELQRSPEAAGGAKG